MEEKEAKELANRVEYARYWLDKYAPEENKFAVKKDLPESFDSLSQKQKELLKAIATGATTKEIAASLKMSHATTETYRIRLMKKLGVANTASLIVYAFRNGIL